MRRRLVQYRNCMNAIAAAIALMILGTSPASSHGDENRAKKLATKPAQLEQVENAFGKTGDPKKISRTIRVGMDDTMRFSPKDISIKQGDTVRFIANNGGKVMHEMVL